jgi:isopentenyl diphosphate isomerase/L-lactate dehydrogenase-like FMN-dependent dehydrogenase
LNRDFAALAQEFKIPVGMGSIRICFRKPEVLEHFQLRSIAPDVPIVANLGAVQIRDMLHSQIIEMLKRLEVDALAVHLNPAQELFQPEGDRDFTGILDAIRRFAAVCPFPLIIKETGAGIGAHEVIKLLQAGAAYVNVAGAGGTNWATVESYRATGTLRQAAADFQDWGNPTCLILDTLRHLESNHRFNGPSLHARSVHQTKAVHAAETSLPKTKHDRHKHIPQLRGVLNGRVLASGGIRTAHDLAVSLALGAYCAGTALPLARAVAAGGRGAGETFISSLATALRAIMLLTSSPSVAALRAQPLLVDPAWRDQVEQYVRLSGGPA